MGRQVWIAAKCREYKLPVVEYPGWQLRGSESFNPDVVVCHHTAGAASGDFPSLMTLVNGRSDLPGPLCNVGLSRSGVVRVIAAGRANHAGRGGWRGRVGNSSAIGIEAESTGRGDWTRAQREAYPILAAALIDGMHSDVSMICGHKEWAPGRKIDPVGIDMNELRFWAGAVLLGHKNPSPLTVKGLSEMPKAKDITAVINDPTHPGGYYLLQADGGVQAKGGAKFHGSRFNLKPKNQVFSIDEWFVGMILEYGEKGTPKEDVVVDYKLVTNKGDLIDLA